MSSRTTDPRATITPDSFLVAPELIGLPLARPRRRAAAMLIDLFLVSLLTQAGSVFFGVLAAVALWRASAPSQKSGYVRTGVRTLLRVSAAIVAFVVILNAMSSLTDRFNDDDEETGVLDEMAMPEFSGELPSTLLPDTLRGTSLEAAIVEMEDDNDDLREDVNELRAEVATLEARAGRTGMIDWMRTFADDLGLGFGWMALYFTAMLVLWRGQTPGKRLLGIRVIRLDGRPLTWWMSFERFGGYAASLSTGLLGFIQILWDRNRQGLHDKAVETVVIRLTPGVDNAASAIGSSA